ncbi:hypothetical protein PHYC_01375 [Phycisphaerales bacterium]|nr:hypothetical protein PHYC_01375 [Phycisphaerales bacterium]
MAIETARIILFAAGAYLTIGVVVAAVFVIAGVDSIDHAAKGSPWSFRLLISPGAAALWPVILRRWIDAARKPHR